MRVRNVPNAVEKVAVSSCYVSDPVVMKGRWQEYFGGDKPIHIEIGSGKGQFITNLAAQNPDIAYIAIERYISVLTKFVKKIPEEGLKNLVVVHLDAKQLLDCFDPGEIQRIYLNFSDPWPKSKHENRRLTYQSFLDLYKIVLSDDGCIEMKTDNVGLFDYSLYSFEQAGWIVQNVTRDLHQSVWNSGNIMTEYEERFSSLGYPIHKLAVKYVPVKD